MTNWRTDTVVGASPEVGSSLARSLYCNILLLTRSSRRVAASRRRYDDSYHRQGHLGNVFDEDVGLIFFG